MDAFKDAWENQVRILTESVDDITTIDDFLAVSGIYMHFQYTFLVANCKEIIALNVKLIMQRCTNVENVSTNFIPQRATSLRT